MQNSRLRIVFAGTPLFAQAILLGLISAGHDVCLVLSQPDRPSGRGLKLQASPVKALASEFKLPLLQPISLKDNTVIQSLINVRADVMIVAAYGLIVPESILNIFQLGCINVHASILPRWRGAAPIQRALLAGDSYTGISIMQMNAGLDTGDVFMTSLIPILPADTSSSLHDRLVSAGTITLLSLLMNLPLQASTQESVGVLYASKIHKYDSRINWTLSAIDVDRHIRTYCSSPRAFFVIDSLLIKVLRSRICEESGEAGRVLDVSQDGVTVACGEFSVLIIEVQKPNGSIMNASLLTRQFALVPRVSALS